MQAISLSCIQIISTTIIRKCDDEAQRIIIYGYFSGHTVRSSIIIVSIRTIAKIVF